jgi:hypothetical protein
MKKIIALRTISIWWPGQDYSELKRDLQFKTITPQAAAKKIEADRYSSGWLRVISRDSAENTALCIDHLLEEKPDETPNQAKSRLNIVVESLSDNLVAIHVISKISSLEKIGQILDALVERNSTFFWFISLVNMIATKQNIEATDVVSDFSKKVKQKLASEAKSAYSPPQKVATE